MRLLKSLKKAWRPGSRFESNENLLGYLSWGSERKHQKTDKKFAALRFEYLPHWKGTQDLVKADFIAIKEYPGPNLFKLERAPDVPIIYCSNEPFPFRRFKRKGVIPTWKTDVNTCEEWVNKYRDRFAAIIAPPECHNFMYVFEL